MPHQDLRQRCRSRNPLPKHNVKAGEPPSPGATGAAAPDSWQGREQSAPTQSSRVSPEPRGYIAMECLDGTAPMAACPEPVPPQGDPTDRSGTGQVSRSAVTDMAADYSTDTLRLMSDEAGPAGPPIPTAATIHAAFAQLSLAAAAGSVVGTGDVAPCRREPEG